MPLGWLDLVKAKFKSPSKYSSIGCKLCTSGVSCAVFERSDARMDCVSYASFGYDDWQNSLAKWVKQEGFENTACYVTLGVSLYQLLQVERPANIPDEELSQALRWSIKDLVPSDSDLAIDYFDLPVQTLGPQKVNVVVADYSLISDIANRILKAELELKCIGVEELAYCDLLSDQSDAAVFLTQEPGREICMSIVKEGQVYFSRRLRGYEKLKSFSKDELAMGLIDNLALEVQRSMDYFESQLKQGPIRKVKLRLDSDELVTISEIIQQFSQVDVSLVEFDLELKLETNHSTISHLALVSGLKREVLS